MAVTVLDEEQIEQLSKKTATLAAEIVLQKTYKPFPEWMTISQIADYLGISENTVRSKIKDGLPVNDKLGFKRFSRRLVDEWMLNKT